jgi:hypothetical protein
MVVYKVNFSAVQNDPMYFFLKSDLILSSDSAAFDYKSIISPVA